MFLGGIEVEHDCKWVKKQTLAQDYFYEKFHHRYLTDF